jgi:hypothetical protein
MEFAIGCISFGASDWKTFALIIDRTYQEHHFEASNLKWEPHVQ